jgi:hypothetical protein
MLDERKRKQNERKFGSWDELPGGGRKYRFEVAGRRGWKAVSIKEVDVLETTVRFLQEIYDNHGILIEVHEKYPVDKGRRKLGDEEEPL